MLRPRCCRPLRRFRRTLLIARYAESPAIGSQMVTLIQFAEGVVMS
jgi:hypothetical protein